MNKGCKDIRPLLQLFLDQELDDLELDQVSEHLNDCMDCLTVLEDEERFRAILKTVHEEDCVAPETLKNRIENWVNYQETALSSWSSETEDETDEVRLMRRTKVRRIFSMAAVAALVVAVAAIIPQKLPETSSKVSQERALERSASRHAKISTFSTSSASAGGVRTISSTPPSRTPLPRPYAQNLQRIQTAHGPALVFEFSRDGKVYRVVQTRNRTMEIRGTSPFLGRYSPSPSRFWNGRNWSPPGGDMTVAAFPVSGR